MTDDRVVHPSRPAQPGWLRWSVVGATAVALALAGRAAMAGNGRSPAVGLAVGVLVAVLGIFGLPSQPIPTVARVLLVVSGAAMARFADLGPSPTSGTEAVLAWVVAAVAVVVLTDRMATQAVADLDPAAGPGVGPPADRIRRRGQMGRTASAIVVLAALAVLVVTVASPLATEHFARSTAPGQAPSARGTGGSALRASDSLDMTERPELTDEVVLTVVADHATFLRGQVFDRWDGRRWTRLQAGRYALGDGGQVVSPAADLGARGPDVFTQRVRVEAGFADLLVAAPTATEVRSATPVGQTLDGTLETAQAPLGRGATYTVTSRSFPLTEAGLRASTGAVPPAVAARYAAPPVTTDRVSALARRIVRDAGAVGTYDRIRALEAWMGANTEYSLDAPTSPAGVDVVDDFLFRSRLGWCEQIASSLVVMARAVGVPARLATGYVATERDRVTGALVVRARDAHAWAEVWFPDVGWVPFDPTADVPLAPTRSDTDTVADWLRGHVVELTVAVLLAVVVAVAGGRALRSVRRRRRARPRSWAARADRDLTRLGTRAGLDRAPGETATAYASRVADRYRRADLAAVGPVIDDHLFAPTPPAAARHDPIDAALAAAAAAPVPEPEPAPAPEPVGQ